MSLIEKYDNLSKIFYSQYIENYAFRILKFLSFETSKS